MDFPISIAICAVSVALALLLGFRRQWSWFAALCAGTAAPLQLLGMTGICTDTNYDAILFSAALSIPFLIAAIAATTLSIAGAARWQPPRRQAVPPATPQQAGPAELPHKVWPLDTEVPKAGPAAPEGQHGAEPAASKAWPSAWGALITLAITGSAIILTNGTWWSAIQYANPCGAELQNYGTPDSALKIVTFAYLLLPACVICSAVYTVFSIWSNAPDEPAGNATP